MTYHLAINIRSARQIVSTRLRRLGRLMLLIGVAALLTGQLPPGAARAQGQKPFILPFKGPPGVDTWLLAQAYGNTVGAYLQRDTTYAAGQGVHFGIDLSAPCGTEIVAIADGVVFAVDDLRLALHRTT